MKNIIKVGTILIIIIFLILYFSYKNGYYIDKNKQTTILTEEKIKEYEEDLKNGVDVSKKDYIVINNTYDNNYTRFTLKLSRKIENGIDKVIKYLFQKIGNTIND